MGRLGPYTSASKMPTRAPICVRVYARFTAVVLFPTPPLHDDTAQHPADRTRLDGSGYTMGTLGVLVNLISWSGRRGGARRACDDVLDRVQPVRPRLLRAQGRCRLRIHRHLHLHALPRDLFCHLLSLHRSQSATYRYNRARGPFQNTEDARKTRMAQQQRRIKSNHDGEDLPSPPIVLNQTHSNTRAAGTYALNSRTCRENCSAQHRENIGVACSPPPYCKQH